ncbi:hypothetical protein FDG66_gp01 [Streptomyces phage phiCAM]|uniref:Uncharacterized protein n=1 Tax=Streptomyces phage phiCAM TaxID=1239386 RepID=K4NXD7_9CAUD|nr:hypothetical protein FDG66_gp01 [Streptomyces phage phiCAM]AFV51321.1 hypothetical protein [Streptomyces phage phiCAM]
MAERSAQEIGAEFGAQVMGGTLGQGEPDPTSPLGRLLTFAAEHGVDAVTPSRVAAAREGRAINP